MPERKYICLQGPSIGQRRLSGGATADEHATQRQRLRICADGLVLIQPEASKLTLRHAIAWGLGIRAHRWPCGSGNARQWRPAPDHRQCPSHRLSRLCELHVQQPSSCSGLGGAQMDHVSTLQACVMQMLPVALRVRSFTRPSASRRNVCDTQPLQRRLLAVLRVCCQV